MIPSEQQARELLNIYAVPDNKKKHLILVAVLARFLAERLCKHDPSIYVNIPLLVAAAYLHDIDKGVGKLPGEEHPDASVRVLINENMPEVAELVKNHPLHCILDPKTAPTSWEEKVLFLADKMVKYDIIGVDERFALWRKELISDKERQRLEKAYPKVKELERDIYINAGLTYQDVTEFAHTVYTTSYQERV